MLGALCELLDWLWAAAAGWRFLFSPSYRHKIIQGWKLERWYYIMGDIAWGLAGMAFSLLPLVGVAFLIWGDRF